MMSITSKNDLQWKTWTSSLVMKRRKSKRTLRFERSCSCGPLKKGLVRFLKQTTQYHMSHVLTGRQCNLRLNKCVPNTGVLCDGPDTRQSAAAYIYVVRG